MSDARYFIVDLVMRILRLFMAIFSLSKLIYFTKLRIRQSFWGAQHVKILIGSKAMTKNTKCFISGFLHDAFEIWNNNLPKKLYRSHNDTLFLLWNSVHQTIVHVTSLVPNKDSIKLNKKQSNKSYFVSTDNKTVSLPR